SGVAHSSRRIPRATRRTCEATVGISAATRAGRRRRTARVDLVGAPQRDFLGTVKPRVYRFDALREAVVLVRDLVPPRAKSSAAVDIPRHERVLDAAEAAIAMERGNRVPMFKTRVPHVMDLRLGRDEGR